MKCLMPDRRITPDQVTTFAGLVAAIAAQLSRSGVYPETSAIVAEVAIALIGVYSNKRLKRVN